ncbi:4845_t:CDS:2 [Cetraspora pellucida]|uniref:4845_t:CDS:1 n=1 Tax=Cetraspora pellucida TaxID=1433469 RepID=A0A9N9NUK3_9GLOM|nr:4845_t:CDS:2 [Cetraspora pellucida]
MLCIRHMLVQNLHTACKKFFDSDDDYKKLLLSIQKIAYVKEMSIVEEAFEEKKDSECWMHVYTKHYPHMGVQSMQRAEGSHSSLKKAIETASGLDQLQDKTAKKKEKNTPKFTTDLPKSQQLLYHDQIPTYMHEHIKKVINVNGDGNCGYRALAICLQRDENEWSEIRKELQK